MSLPSFKPIEWRMDHLFREDISFKYENDTYLEMLMAMPGIVPIDLINGKWPAAEFFANANGDILRQCFETLFAGQTVSVTMRSKFRAYLNGSRPDDEHLRTLSQQSYWKQLLAKVPREGVPISQQFQNAFVLGWEATSRILFAQCVDVLKMTLMQPESNKRILTLQRWQIFQVLFRDPDVWRREDHLRKLTKELAEAQIYVQAPREKDYGVDWDTIVLCFEYLLQKSRLYVIRKGEISLQRGTANREYARLPALSEPTLLWFKSWLTKWIEASKLAMHYQSFVTIANAELPNCNTVRKATRLREGRTAIEQSLLQQNAFQVREGGFGEALMRLLESFGSSDSEVQARMKLFEQFEEFAFQTIKAVERLLAPLRLKHPRFLALQFAEAIAEHKKPVVMQAPCLRKPQTDRPLTPTSLGQLNFSHPIPTAPRSPLTTSPAQQGSPTSPTRPMLPTVSSTRGRSAPIRGGQGPPRGSQRGRGRGRGQ